MKFIPRYGRPSDLCPVFLGPIWKKRPEVVATPTARQETDSKRGARDVDSTIGLQHKTHRQLQLSTATMDRDSLVYKAKLAEQAERFDEMVSSEATTGE